MPALMSLLRPLSYELCFLKPEFAGDWHAGMEALEQSTLASLAWDDTDESMWQTIKTALPTDDYSPISDEPGKPRRLEHDATGVTLIAHPRQVSIDVPYSAGPASELAEYLAELVHAVQTATEQLAFDPQADAGFLETGNDDIHRVSARSQHSLERIMTHPSDLWMSRGSMVALTKDELKQLRSTKGDVARRARAKELLVELPAERIMRMGEEWSFLNGLCGEPFGELGIFVGQRMHKGGSYEVTLLKNVPDQVEYMDGHGFDEIKELTAAMTDEAIRYRTPFWVYRDWDAAGISNLMSPERAERTGRLWNKVREFLRTAAEAGNAPLFVVAHDQAGRRLFR